MHKLLFISVILVLFWSCQAPQYTAIYGSTMGTYYSIKADIELSDVKDEIDQILEDINMEVSTYIDSSFISLFNVSENGVRYFKDNGLPVYFDANLQLAKTIYTVSEGAFDPTVMPLVNYWGFGYVENVKTVENNKAAIDSILGFIGFDKIEMKEITPSTNFLLKSVNGVELDFSAIAKGHAIDVLRNFLEKKGARSFLVEIGGEVYGKGKNEKANSWTIGINKPVEGAGLNEIFKLVHISDKAVATSGNYRNYYTANGVTYSHTINPKTGYPERSNLLSATVVADDCIMADAFATGFMVMGLEKSLALAKSTPEIEAYFIYSSEDGSMRDIGTSGFKKFESNE